MHARVVLTEVTRPGRDLAYLRAGAGGQPEPRADRVTIARRPDQAHQQRVALTAAVVSEQVGRASVVGDEQVEVAVVVDVSGNQRTANLVDGEPGTRLPADIPEPARADVLQQKPRLGV